MKARKVFLSHASQDRNLAAKIAETLEGHGVSVWYSATAIHGSDEWQTEIGDALASCRWFLLLATVAACRRPAKKPWWVQREVLYALSEPRYAGHVIPLVRPGANLKRLAWYLPQIQYIDFRGDYHHACAELLRTWSKRYKGSPK